MTQRWQISIRGVFAALLIATGLAACSSPDPVLYTIAAMPGSPVGGGPGIVLLERVDIPRYLDRSTIVKSSDNYRLDLRANDWWGEPLAAMLRRVLRDALAQRLPQSTVVGESAALAPSPDAAIDLELQRLDQDASSSVVLQAQASVTFKGRKGAVLRSFRYSAPAPAPTAAGEVEAISAAVGQLADGLAAMLARR